MKITDLIATLAAGALVSAPLPASAAGGNCAARMNALVDSVVGKLDRAGAPWVTTDDVVEPFCTGELTTRDRRRIAEKTQSYIELVFGNGTYVVRHWTFLTLPSLQSYADPDSVVGIAEFRDVVVCPDGFSYYLTYFGNDVPADVGSASGSNPQIVDFGGDDYLSLFQTECVVP